MIQRCTKVIPIERVSIEELIKIMNDGKKHFFDTFCKEEKEESKKLEIESDINLIKCSASQLLDYVKKDSVDIDKVYLDLTKFLNKYGEEILISYQKGEYSLWQKILKSRKFDELFIIFHLFKCLEEEKHLFLRSSIDNQIMVLDCIRRYLDFFIIRMNREQKEVKKMVVIDENHKDDLLKIAKKIKKIIYPSGSTDTKTQNLHEEFKLIEYALDKLEGFSTFPVPQLIGGVAKSAFNILGIVQTSVKGDPIVGGEIVELFENVIEIIGLFKIGDEVSKLSRKGWHDLFLFHARKLYYVLVGKKLKKSEKEKFRKEVMEELFNAFISFKKSEKKDYSGSTALAYGLYTIIEDLVVFSKCDVMKSICEDCLEGDIGKRLRMIIGKKSKLTRYRLWNKMKFFQRKCGFINT